jgi:hypothetical protein
MRKGEGFTRESLGDAHECDEIAQRYRSVEDRVITKPLDFGPRASGRMF